MSDVKILAITNRDWNTIFSVPNSVEIECVDDARKAKEKIYDVTFLDRCLAKKEFDLIRTITKAYTVFYTGKVSIDSAIEMFLKSRKAQFISEENIQPFFDGPVVNFFHNPYGEKYNSTNMLIQRGFNGKVEWNGAYSVRLQGDFGDEYHQVAYWKNRIPIYRGKCTEFYFEYEKSGEVSIILELTQYEMGTVDKRVKVNRYTEEELSDVFFLDNKCGDTTIFVSIKAKGSGELLVKCLHDRHSRRGYGAFIVGGERHVSKTGEEIFSYFDPGDMRPPLVVYYSGFKLWEGFEGYNMLKRLGVPFLLFADPRLDGGGFYLGKEDYEQKYVDIIRSKMDELNFCQSDVILTGMSMGSTGALNCACDIKPHAVIVGKPIANLGNMARNEMTIRPGGFMASLNVLNTHAGGMERSHVDKLNQYLWNKISKADFSNTTFAISYMIEDDFDRTAYNDLISNLYSAGVTIYGKGIHGRHNDNTPEINRWFIERLKSFLREDFKREI